MKNQLLFYSFTVLTHSGKLFGILNPPFPTFVVYIYIYIFFCPELKDFHSPTSRTVPVPAVVAAPVRVEKEEKKPQLRILL